MSNEWDDEDVKKTRFVNNPLQEANPDLKATVHVQGIEDLQATVHVDLEELPSKTLSFSEAIVALQNMSRMMGFLARVGNTMEPRILSEYELQFDWEGSQSRKLSVRIGTEILYQAKDPHAQDRQGYLLTYTQFEKLWKWLHEVAPAQVIRKRNPSK